MVGVTGVTDINGHWSIFSTEWSSNHDQSLTVTSRTSLDPFLTLLFLKMESTNFNILGLIVDQMTYNFDSQIF